MKWGRIGMLTGTGPSMDSTAREKKHQRNKDSFTYTPGRTTKTCQGGRPDNRVIDRQERNRPW